MKPVESEEIAGLEAGPQTGSPAKLSEEQQWQLPEYVSHGATAYGFRGKVWTSLPPASQVQNRSSFNS